MDSFRRTARGTGLALAGLALAWGLLHYGATETTSPYRVFLLLAPGLALVLASAPLRGPRLAVSGIVGLALGAAFLLSGPLQGRGLLIAILGWAAMFLVLVWGRRGLGPVVGFLLVIGAFETLLGLVQALGGVDYIGSYFRDVGRRATGTLINHNHFAGLMNMLTALAAGLVFAGYRRRQLQDQPVGERLGWAWLTALLAALMGLTVLLSLSRAGTVVLAGVLLSLGGLVLSSPAAGRGTRRAGLLLVTIVALVGGLAAAIGTDALQQRYGRLADDWQLRATLYRDSLDVIRESPWTGVGPGLFAYRLRPHQTLDAATWWRYAHNDYLQTAAEWGIPLAAAFWILVAWRWLATVKVFRTVDEPRIQGLALGVSGALLSILLHSLVDFNLQIPTTLMVFGAVLGLSWVVSDAARHCRLEAARQ